MIVVEDDEATSSAGVHRVAVDFRIEEDDVCPHSFPLSVD